MAEEKDEKELRFERWLVELDHTIMTEVIMPNAMFVRMYNYFNSDPEDHPLNPREFFHFWGSCSDDEQLCLMMQFG